MNYAAALLLCSATVLTQPAWGQMVRASPVPIAIYKVAPEYTEEGWRARIEGNVLLRTSITVKGRAENIRVMKPLGHGLDQKAIECLRKWRFQPALKQGEAPGIPYEVRHYVAIEFRLENSN
jgi:protein TonB